MDGYKQTYMGLIRRRKRIASDILKHHADIKRLHGELETIDKSLVLFGHPDPSGIHTPAPVRRLFKQKQLSRLIRTIERECPSMTTTHEVTKEIFARLGWQITPEKYDRAYKSVRNARRRIARNRAMVIG